MGKGKQEQLQGMYKELEIGFKDWLAQQNQSLLGEAVFATATNALKGAAIGGLLGVFFPPNRPRPRRALCVCLSLSPYIYGGPVQCARNHAVSMGLNYGIGCVLERIKGKKDLQTTAVAAFISGFAFELVRGGKMTPTQTGVIHALLDCVCFKLCEEHAIPPIEVEDADKKIRGKLSSLDLDTMRKT